MQNIFCYIKPLIVLHISFNRRLFSFLLCRTLLQNHATILSMSRSRWFLTSSTCARFSIRDWLHDLLGRSAHGTVTQLRIRYWSVFLTFNDVTLGLQVIVWRTVYFVYISPHKISADFERQNVQIFFILATCGGTACGGTTCGGLQMSMHVWLTQHE